MITEVFNYSEFLLNISQFVPSSAKVIIFLHEVDSCFLNKLFETRALNFARYQSLHFISDCFSCRNIKRSVSVEAKPVLDFLFIKYILKIYALRLFSTKTNIVLELYYQLYKAVIC